MAYSVDLREKAILLLEKGKSNTEVAELLEIGIATLDFFQNLNFKLKIVNTCNQVKSESKTFSTISVPIT